MKYLMVILFLAPLLMPFSRVHAASFTVSPKVCVISHVQDFCDLDLTFEWQGDMVGDVCIYEQSKKIHCWQQQRAGEFNYKARVQVETIYSLINSKSGVLLAKAQVEVQSTHVKKSRRRLRSPWSFF
jgi:hypothetical protein